VVPSRSSIWLSLLSRKHGGLSIDYRLLIIYLACWHYGRLPACKHRVLYHNSGQNATGKFTAKAPGAGAAEIAEFFLTG